MSQPTSAAPVLPLPAEGAPPAPAAPQAASPAAAAPSVPQGTIEPPLSTATLTEKVLRQLKGEKPAPAAAVEPAKPAGSEPSAAGTADPVQTSPIEEDDDKPTPHEQSLPPQAVAALAAGRQQRRELKQELKAAQAQNQQLQESLQTLTTRLEALEGKAPNGTPKAGDAPHAKANGHARTSGPVPKELAEAEAAEAQAGETKRWASGQLRTLNRVLARGEDAEPVLAALRTELEPHKVAVPTTPEAAQDWLETLRDNADEQLADLRVTTRLLRHDVALDHDDIRRESETLAAQWLPEAKDAAKPQAQKLAKLKATFPELAEHPFGARFMALAVRGWEVIEPELNKPATNGKATNGAAARATTPAAPARPVPVLPGASSALPPSRNGEQVNGSSAALKRMQDATNPEEFAAAKADWMKSLATTTPLAAAR